MSRVGRFSSLALLTLGPLVAPGAQAAWASGTACGRVSIATLATQAERTDTIPGLFPSGWPFPADETPIEGGRGMVVSADSLASAVGLAVLQDGGNAIDAAVAVHFALSVVYPRAGNLGGGGFMVVRTEDGREATLDFRERAPFAARRDMFAADGDRAGSLSRTGHLAAGVPGSVAGMAKAHRRFGRLAWERLLEPCSLARSTWAFPRTRSKWSLTK